MRSSIALFETVSGRVDTIHYDSLRGDIVSIESHQISIFYKEIQILREYYEQ